MNAIGLFINGFRVITAIMGVLGFAATLVTLAIWLRERGSLAPFLISFASVYSAGFSATLLGIYDRVGEKEKA